MHRYRAASQRNYPIDRGNVKSSRQYAVFTFEDFAYTLQRRICPLQLPASRPLWLTGSTEKIASQEIRCEKIRADLFTTTAVGRACSGITRCRIEGRWVGQFGGFVYVTSGITGSKKIT